MSALIPPAMDYVVSLLFFYKDAVALNNLQKLICHSTKKPNQSYIFVDWFIFLKIPFSPQIVIQKFYLLIYLLCITFFLHEILARELREMVFFLKLHLGLSVILLVTTFQWNDSKVNVINFNSWQKRVFSSMKQLLNVACKTHAK